MSDGFVTVADFPNAFEAEVAKMELDVNEISCVIVGDNLVHMQPYAFFRVEIKVCEADVEKAKAVLDSIGDDSEGDA